MGLQVVQLLSGLYAPIRVAPTNSRPFKAMKSLLEGGCIKQNPTLLKHPTSSSVDRCAQRPFSNLCDCSALMFQGSLAGSVLDLLKPAGSVIVLLCQSHGCGHTELEEPRIRTTRVGGLTSLFAGAQMSEGTST